MAHPARSEASGIQIAFLIFCVVLLAIPAAKYSGVWSDEESALVSRLFVFGMFLAVAAVFPAMRRACVAMLRAPIAPGHRAEIAAVTAFHVLTPFAYAGGLVLWIHFTEGPMAIAARLKGYGPDEAMLASAFSAVGLVTVLLGCTLAPAIEEVVFRGFLFRAWMRQWGWFAGMLATAAAFAFYHSLFIAPFVASILYTCLYLRTGSLRAPILVHCAYNAAVFGPLLGRFVFRGFGYDAANLANWWFHFVCLFLHVAILPLYVSMAAEAELPSRPDEVPGRP